MQAKIPSGFRADIDHQKSKNRGNQRFQKGTYCPPTHIFLKIEHSIDVVNFILFIINLFSVWEGSFTRHYQDDMFSFPFVLRNE